MCMNGPQTWTTVWELTVGVGEVGDRQRKVKGENWDKCKTTIKMIKKLKNADLLIQEKKRKEKH